MLQARDITWRQNSKDILQGISLDLAKGECVGLVGPNGSGKSSLLKILACLETPSSGCLSFQGREISGQVPLDIRRRIAVVFQEALLLNASVYENVALGLKLRGTPRKEIAPRVRDWLERFGITHLANQHAHSLSGGEAQRASLARAFVWEPDIIFLDEPFSALDAPTKEALVTDLTDIFRTTGTTAMLVSHDFRDIERLATRALILIQGQIAAAGSPTELLSASQQPPVDAFLAHWRVTRPQENSQEQPRAAI